MKLSMINAVIFNSAIFTAMTFAPLLLSCNPNSPQSEQTATTESQQAETQPMATSGGGAMMQQLHAGCPMVVEGANVAVSDTDGGVALTFTTKGSDVSDLRARVQHMAQMYEMHRGQGSMMWHHMGMRGNGRHRGSGMGMGHMSGHGPMPAAKAKVTNLEDGARLELEPTDPSQLESLREHARWHQKRMESGECWMLQEPPAQEGSAKK